MDYFKQHIKDLEDQINRIQVALTALQGIDNDIAVDRYYQYLDHYEDLMMDLSLVTKMHINNGDDICGNQTTGLSWVHK